jgi:hypothetical protein
VSVYDRLLETFGKPNMPLSFIKFPLKILPKSASSGLLVMLLPELRVYSSLFMPNSDPIIGNIIDVIPPKYYVFDNRNYLLLLILLALPSLKYDYFVSYTQIRLSASLGSSRQVT